LNWAARGTRAATTLLQSVLADNGYAGQPFAQGVQEVWGEAVTVQIAKRSELHKFAVNQALTLK
jgi:regulator of RNase E activity RraA